MIPFPLYHGSSSHYLFEFKLGAKVGLWPHKVAALNLLRETTSELKGRGAELDYGIELALNQESERSNWQHGGLYVTPSKRTAVKYAATGASCGGELLEMCRRNVNQLRTMAPAAAENASAKYPALQPLLAGTGTPILLEFEGLSASSLLPEIPERDVNYDLAFLEKAGELTREEGVGQQLNFRVEVGHGVVSRVYRVILEDPSDRLGAFQLNDIAP